MSKHFIVLLCLLSPCMLLAEPGAEELEARLAAVEGREKLELLVELMAIYREHKPRRAVARSAEVFELLRSNPDDELELSALNCLSGAYIRLAEYQEALLYGSRAEKLARTREDKPALALALNNLGDIYRYRNEYEHARERLFEAVRLYEELGDGSGLGETIKDLGITYRLTGDFPTALKYYFRALQAFEGENDQMGVAQVFNSLGIVYTKLAQFDKAEEYLLRALVIQEGLGNERLVSMILNNLGFAYLKLGEPKQALDQYYRAVKIKERLGDERGMAFSLNGMGSSHLQTGELDLAMDYYERAFNLKKRLGDRKGMATLLLEGSEIPARRGAHEQALDMLNEALAIATEVNARNAMRDICHSISDIYTSMGRYKEALESFRRYKEIEDEIFNEKNSRIIAEMQARYESEQKAREIDVLKQQQSIDALELTRQKATSLSLIGGLALMLLILLLTVNSYRLRTLATRERVRKEERERYIAELEAKNAEVEAKNAEMERFTYTVSHDLRSPLVTIRGFLGLLKKDSAKGITGRMTRDIASIDDAADKMAQLLDELLELSRIGRVVNTPQQVPLAELAREAADLVAGPIARRGVEIDVAPDLPVVFGDRPRLREVLQNLVENAVKFMGDQPAPRIEIGWREDEKEGVCFVRDNGSGIKEKYHEKIFGLFDRLNPEVEGTGVGLALVKRIVEVHGGNVWVESEGEGKGSTFCFNLSPEPRW